MMGDYIKDNKMAKIHTFFFFLLYTINTADPSDFHLRFQAGFISR